MLFAIVFKTSKGNSNYRYMLNSEIKSEGLVGRLSMCDLSGNIPHTSVQSYLHFVQEYQLLHLEGGPWPPLSFSAILVCPLDSTLVGIIIGVRQSLCTMEGWALSFEGLTMVVKKEVIMS